MKFKKEKWTPPDSQIHKALQPDSCIVSVPVQVAVTWNPPACATCKYMVGPECRRYPPVTQATGFHNFPHVKAEQWCGEWGARPC
jgi:hypothetical protein